MASKPGIDACLFCRRLRHEQRNLPDAGSHEVCKVMDAWLREKWPEWKGWKK